MADEALKQALDEARALLAARTLQREPVWPALAAAAFFAVSALGFAAATILAPPTHLQSIHSDRLRGGD